jgi:macrolide-specific efflux system membrane fusion protein
VVSDYAEANATKIAVGQPATITLAALPDTEITGEVTSVSPTASVVSNVVTYPVTVALENVPSDVREGMTAEVSVIVQTATDVLELPSAAITTLGSASTVTVLSNGVRTVKTVTVGLVGTSNTEILSGLTEGETVVEPTASVAASTGTTTGGTTTGGGGFGGGGFGGGGGGFGGGGGLGGGGLG